MPKKTTKKCLIPNKKGLSFLFVGLMSVSTININAQTIQLYINNNNIQTSGVSQINEKDIMVPIRELCDSLGGEIHYKAVENQYYILLDDTMLVVQIGNPDIWVDGEEIRLNVAPQTINGKLCIPARTLVEQLKFNVMWDSSNNVLYINDRLGTNPTQNTEVQIPILPEGTDTIISDSTLDNTNNSPVINESTNGTNNSIGSNSEIVNGNIKYIAELNQLVISKKGTVNLSNIEIVDDYMQRIIKVKFDRSYSQLFNAATIAINDDALTSLSIKNNTYTEIELRTPIVKAATITEDQNNIYIKLNKPKEVYNKIVVLDAGHGDHDPGAIGINGITEKALNLQIMNETVRALENKGVTVYLTRSDDTFVALDGRTKVANEIESDYFVSIHNNSGVEIANGTEVLYYPTDEISKRFASIVQEKFVATLGVTNRGIKARSDLAVLRGSKMPAILIEAGFITNQKDYGMLVNPEKQRQIGTIIAESILQMFN